MGFEISRKFDFMRRVSGTLATFLALLLFVNLAFSVTAEELVKNTEKGGSGLLEIVKDWRVLTALILAITIILVSLAYMAGQSFEMPDLKAWASVEFTQVITTAIIILLIFAVISFLDTVFALAVNGSGITQCNFGDTKLCAIKTAESYIKSLTDVGVEAARKVFSESVHNGWISAERLGINCSVIYCAQAGFSIGYSPFLQMDVERAQIELEAYQNILSSLFAQLYFVSQISFKFAPMLLAAGILARSFFITRKLGGLLLATAIGVMFVFPAMYALDWFTLNVTLYGDRVLEPPAKPVVCPEECGIAPPIAFHQPTGTTFNTVQEILDFSNKFKLGINPIDAEKLKNGEEESYFDSGLYGCQYYSINNPFTKKNPGSEISCPSECRDLPYPQGSTLCDSPNVQQVCGLMPKQCKIIRYIKNPDPNLALQCPQECKTIPPLKNDCGTISACRNAPNNCKQTLKDNPAYIPDKCDQAVAACPVAVDINKNIDPYNSCKYAVPSTGKDCDQSCNGCPVQCRISNLANYESLPEICKNSEAACKSCPNVCKVSADALANKKGCAPAPSVRYAAGDIDNCALAPLSCRIKNYDYSGTNINDYADADINGYICSNDKDLFQHTSENCKAGACGVTPAKLRSDCKSFDPKADNPKFCRKCPISCRFKSDNPAKDCSDFSFNELDLSNIDCSLGSCPNSCRVAPPTVDNTCKAFNFQPCDLCPVRCRALLPDGTLPSNCPADKCNNVLCPTQCKEKIPTLLCQQCIPVQESYTYSPPIRTNCAELCSSPSGGVGSDSPGEFAKKSAEGMVGREDIKDVSTMLIPAYMLPLLNILVTIIFIKTVSPTLGGDIEIPGLPKIL